MQPKPLHILISPLDWGLGHAARCIPIFSRLIEAGHKVTLAGYGRSLIMLRKEFPLLQSIEMPGFSPSYPGSGNLVLHLFLRLPQFIGTMVREHHHLKKLISQHHFDIIISDNRYGFRNKNLRSILITHQVMIKTPDWLRFAEFLLYCVSRLLISRFDECWIPDDKESPGLSGDLSHKYPLPANAKFIGPLSRFQITEQFANIEITERKITAIISGPEPQRSIFEALVTKQLRELDQPAIIIGGKPESVEIPDKTSYLSISPYLGSAELQSAISASSLVICRSGYSSVMDLQTLGVKALFVPTPGQTEQIYLAKLYQEAGRALWRTQENLNLKTDIPEAIKYPGFIKKQTGNGLLDTIGALKKK
jgi:UDP:flavonoid glycosyltransferase YjiC (YdhE family)